MWVLLCSFKWPVIGKILSYFEQLKGFSPVWGWFHNKYVEKLLSQFLHLNGFSPVCVLSCSFKWPVIGFSPVWVWSHGEYVDIALVTICALEWLLSRVVPLMFFQVASYWEDLVILWAFKRLLSRVGLVPWWVCWEALVTVFALAWLLSHMGPSCSFKWPGLRLSCHTLSIQNVPWWVCW